MTTIAPEKTVHPYWFQQATLPIDDLDGELSSSEEWSYGTDARFIAMMGGTGGGKTFWGPRWLADRIMRDYRDGNGKEAQYIVVGRTHRMTIDILVPELRKCFKDTYLEGAWHASKSSYTIPSTGGTIYFRSADEPYRIEGFHTRGIWVDEPSEMPALIWIVVQSRVGLYQAPVLFTGYPTDMGWYYESIFKPWENGDPDYCCVQFDSTENPMYSQKEMDRAKATLPGWLYDMRHRGKFRKPFGLVYPDFDASCYVEPFDIPEDWPTYAIVDPGVHYGALFMAWNQGVYYVYNEYYEEQVKSAPEYAEAMLAKVEGVNQGWLYDPARLTDAVNLAAAGCGPFYKAMNPVRPGIVTLTGLIKTGRFKVMRGRTPAFTDMMAKYRWPTDPVTGKVVDGAENPIKKYDHLPDCARYGAHTLESAPLEERGIMEVDLGEEISPY